MSFPKVTEAERIRQRDAKRDKKVASDEARAAVDRRSGGRCEVRIMCSGASETAKHHRKRAGRKDTEANLLAVCEADHRWIHANVAKSFDMGLLVKSFDDPVLIPIVPAAPQQGDASGPVLGDPESTAAAPVTSKEAVARAGSTFGFTADTFRDGVIA